MPAVSKKQERFMQAVAHNPAFAKKAGVPQSVGKEFTKSGGSMVKAKKTVKKMAMGGSTRTSNRLYGAPQPRSATDRESPVEAQKRASAFADKAKAAQQKMQDMRGGMFGGPKASGSPTARKDNSTTVNTTNFKQTSTGKAFKTGGRVKKMADGGLSTVFKAVPGMASNASKAVGAVGKAVANNAGTSSSGKGPFSAIFDINKTVAGVVDRENKKAEAEKAHKQAVAEQLGREARAKAYNARAERMGMPKTSPTGFDLPKTRGGNFGMKTGGKVKKMAVGGMTSMYKGPTPPKTAYGAGAKSTPSYATQAAPTPTKYGNEVFDRSAQRAAVNAQQAKDTAARNARAQEVRKYIAARAEGKGVPGSGMKAGGRVKKMATGGLAAGHKAADGVARKGRTKAIKVKMSRGGKCG